MRSVAAQRIGRKQRSQARYYLRSQAEIDDLLDLLVRLRKTVAETPNTAPLMPASGS